MKPEHGSRFSHVSNNAGKALLYFDEMIDFCKLNGHSMKLRELHRLMTVHENLIKSELQSLAACWFLILDPLWITLRHSIAKDSVQLIDQFTDYAKTMQDASNPSVLVSNPANNPFMHMHAPAFEDSSIEANILSAIPINQDNEVLNESLKKMLKSAADYMLKLSNNWVRDSIPDAPVPFSNQVTILINFVFHDAYHIFKFSEWKVILHSWIKLLMVVPERMYVIDWN
jgi:hypothetical protein